MSSIQLLHKRNKNTLLYPIPTGWFETLSLLTIEVAIGFCGPWSMHVGGSGFGFGFQLSPWLRRNPITFVRACTDLCTFVRVGIYFAELIGCASHVGCLNANNEYTFGSHSWTRNELVALWYNCCKLNTFQWLFLTWKLKLQGNRSRAIRAMIGIGLPFIHNPISSIQLTLTHSLSHSPTNSLIINFLPTHPIHMPNHDIITRNRRPVAHSLCLVRRACLKHIPQITLCPSLGRRHLVLDVLHTGWSSGRVTRTLTNPWGRDLAGRHVLVKHDALVDLVHCFRLINGDCY